MTSTENTPPEQDEYDPVAALTINELNDGNRQLKASVMAAVTSRNEHYEKALAIVAWLHHRRSDPGAGLGRFLELPFSDLMDELLALKPAADPTTPKRSSS